ncbi:hypothetical protein HPB47_011212, partial [Ixodes persulcatus]
PRVRVHDGHLVFEAAQNKNISFQSGGGGILLNGKDLAVVMASVAEASRTLAPSATSDQLQSLADTVAKVEELRERLDQLKTNCDGLRNQLRQTTRNLTRSLQMPVLRLKAAMRRLQNNLRRDACSSNPCGHGGTCVSRYNGYLCLCPAGWQGGRCEEDVDECAHLAGSDLGCQNGATCVNTPGAYRCQCTQGFFGAHCTERQDDCSLASASALCDHGTCIGLPRVAGQPGFRCLCDQGWTTGPGQLSCSQDVNECASGRHFCSKNPPVACLNFPGGFGCGPCPQGYSGDGYSCSDVNECLVNNGGCSQNPRVDCFNTIGSRSCGPCPPGYVGDGVTCTYLGLCNVDNGGCSPLATCIARSGSFRECRCPAGYVGSGVGPNGCVAAARQPDGQQPEQQPLRGPVQRTALPARLLSGVRQQLPVRLRGRLLGPALRSGFRRVHQRPVPEQRHVPQRRTYGCRLHLHAGVDRAPLRGATAGMWGSAARHQWDVAVPGDRRSVHPQAELHLGAEDDSR